MSRLISHRGTLAACLTCWFALAAAPAIAAQTAADLVITNGHVYTGNPNTRWAEAVVVKGGKIAYVGSNAGAMAKRGRGARELDLGGRLMLPGFIDPHDHVDGRASELYLVNLGSQLSPHTLDGYRKIILDFRASHPGLKELRGNGFDPWILPAIGQSRKRQPRELFDDIVSDVPAIIISWTGHQAWVNSKALELAGITRDTPDPPGEGHIEHDPVTGEPNGILLEMGAFYLVLNKLPESDLTVEQYRTGILSYQREVAPQRGITGVLMPTDFRTETFFPAMQQLSDEKLLTVRYRVAQWEEDDRREAQIPELVAVRARYPGGPYFKLNTIKVFAPWPQEPLNRTVAALDKLGFQVYFHNVGDTASYAAVLDAFEYALKQNGRRDSRHIISHVRDAAAPLAARFKALGVRADADWHPAPKSFYDAGVPTTLSSDYPVRDPSPLVKIGEGVKRGIPLEALIDSATIKGAEAQFAENETGSIMVGKAADLIVLDRDLFKVTPEEIAGAKVLLTLFAGNEVFRDAAF